MIPPSPTINDAIGLLAALTDKDRVDALLAELKEKQENADKVFEQARAAQVDADARGAALKKAGDDFSRMMASANDQLSERLRVADETDARLKKDSAEFDQRDKDLNDREARLGKLGASLDNREARLQAAEKALAARGAAVSARETEVAEREAVIAPIARRLSKTATS